MHENSYLEINLDILKNNALTIINKYGEYKYKIAMIKANAYGHGMYIINTLIESGFNYFAVSSLDEALNIRKYNKTVPILCTEPIDLKYLKEIIDNNITLSIHNVDYFKELINLKFNKIKVHLLIDSGINRLGIKTKEEIKEIYDLVNEKIEIEGLYTHFATSGVIDKNWDNQVSKFKEIISSIDLTKVEIIHMPSSFSLLSHPKIDICNGFRIGSSLFGINTYISYGNSIKDKLRLFRNNYYKKKYNLSDIIYNPDLNLKTCMSLYSKVIELKEVNTNEYIGYGTDYKTSEKIKIAVVDIGYEDGIGRINNNRKVIINNKFYNVIGEIGMCMIILKVDDKVKINDKVLLMGGEIKVSSMCIQKNESVQEVFLSLGKVLPKKYIKETQEIYSVYYEEKGEL